MEQTSDGIQYVEDTAASQQFEEYGAQSLAVESQQLAEIQALREDLVAYTDGLAVLAAQDSEPVTASESSLSSDQYDYLVRSLQLSNTLSLVIMLLVGATCGLCAWRAFVHSWGSHG